MERATQTKIRGLHSQSLVYSGISTVFEIAIKVTQLPDLSFCADFAIAVFLFARSNKLRVTIFPGTCAALASLR